MAHQNEPEWIPTRHDAQIIHGGPQKPVETLVEAESLMAELSGVDFPMPVLEGVFTYLGPDDDPVVFSG